MSEEIKESKHERKVRFHTDAPAAKHDYRYRTRPNIRMAGKVWSESPRERQQRLARERLSGKSKSIPVGVGFGERDSFGPDNDYYTVESLNNIRGPIR
jgi:hypothetical protein